MSRLIYTPGPWTYDPNTETVDSGTTAIAGINVDEWDYDMAQANARLIAAAPEMYAALKALLDPDAEGDIHMAVRAIAKAEGREP